MHTGSTSTDRQLSQDDAVESSAVSIGATTSVSGMPSGVTGGDTPSSTEQWQPTPEWFHDWKSKLPIQTITRLIHCLLPMVEEECQEKGLIDQTQVLEYLQKVTMVGLLPVPHPIIIRNYQPNTYTALWFTSYMWGVIFSRSQSLAMFDWRKIRLIVINNR